MKKREKPRFLAPKATGLEYERSLRKVARNVAKLIASMGDPEKILQDPTLLDHALHVYAQRLKPWATDIAQTMINNAERMNKRQWFSYAEEIGLGLKQELESADIGDVVDELLQRQIHYITSLPLEAAERVQRLAKESLATGARYNQLKNEIMKSDEVTESRAMLIARTETSRASFALTRARAESVGSTGYVWRSHKDKRTRQSHKEMNGKFVAWDKPPTLDNLTGHAGEIPNCRCFTLIQF